MKRRVIPIHPPDRQSLVKKGERDLKKINLKKYVKVIKLIHSKSIVPSLINMSGMTLQDYRRFCK